MNAPTPLLRRLQIALRRAYLNRVARRSAHEVEHYERAIVGARHAMAAAIRRSDAARLELVWLDVARPPITYANGRIDTNRLHKDPSR